MICKNCGATNQDDFNYCCKCGLKLEKTEDIKIPNDTELPSDNSQNSRQSLPFLRIIPGFRSNTFWKMLVATTVYIIFAVALISPTMKTSSQSNEQTTATAFYQQIDALKRNGNIDKAKKVYSDMNAKYPNSPETTKAKNLLFGTEALTQQQKEEIAKEEQRKAEEEKRKAEESQKQKEQQEQAKKNKLQSIIRVSKVFTSDPNSAGGVDFSVIWQNTSDKVIKYIDFTVVPYNAVNDTVKCTIRRSSESTGRVTGPVNPKQWYGEGYRWSNAWYNNTIVRAELIGVRVEYMDGTVENISRGDIKSVTY
ncbi:hypothetical protein [Sporomusa aerivorans]|uniref:hypothetical protein n=1 Tax=Sporomusa aerivorans TaxID=204936 RepID=UPI00352AA6C1